MALNGRVVEGRENLFYAFIPPKKYIKCKEHFLLWFNVVSKISRVSQCWFLWRFIQFFVGVYVCIWLCTLEYRCSWKPELEAGEIMSCVAWVPGKKLRSSIKTEVSSTELSLNHWATSLVPNVVFYLLIIIVVAHLLVGFETGTHSVIQARLGLTM